MPSFSNRFGIRRDMSGLSTNPFTDDFTKEELSYYALSKPYSKDGIDVRLSTIKGRVDDYLNSRWHTGNIKNVPVLRIDGPIWMSLTPMEIQSAYLPIALSGGKVGTAGLGLGYYALRAASNPDVEEVHAYEIEPRIIDYFLSTFQGRPELEKIKIHNKDVRKLSAKEKRDGFDTFFMDVYQDMLPDEVVDDINYFGDINIDPNNYRFWGQEHVYLDALMEAEAPEIPKADAAYLATWRDTERDGEPIADFYYPTTEQEFRDAVFSALKQ